VKIAFLRHGPTEWNAQGRIQGKRDEPLSAEGRALFAQLAPPAGLSHARAYTSPLARARETATLLGLKNPIVDARLIEHDWGAWEGMTREEILARDGADAFVRAGSGIAFTPRSGERTVDLIARVRAFLAEVGERGEDAIAVTHRGVLRSAYAIATGWQMLTPMPDALDLTKALVLTVDRDGRPQIAALNVPLEPRPV
jgi:broad specificity phosphatase PhoE